MSQMTYMYGFLVNKNEFAEVGFTHLARGLQDTSYNSPQTRERDRKTKSKRRPRAGGARAGTGRRGGSRAPARTELRLREATTLFGYRL